MSAFRLFLEHDVVERTGANPHLDIRRGLSLFLGEI